MTVANRLGLSPVDGSSGFSNGADGPGNLRAESTLLLREGSARFRGGKDSNGKSGRARLRRAPEWQRPPVNRRRSRKWRLSRAWRRRGFGRYSQDWLCESDVRALHLRRCPIASQKE